MSLSPGGFPPGYEWDEDKNQANIRKHGIDFRNAVKVFDQPTLDRIDDRQDYGEVRMRSIGQLSGLVVAMVVHTDRDEVTRLISARAASDIERQAYRVFERELAGERTRGRDRERDGF